MQPEPPPHKTVLSVGADPLAREIVRRALGARGIDVVEHELVANAIASFGATPCHALVVDVALAGALECIARARMDERTRDLPIVALANGAWIDRALGAGATDCCEQPLHAELFVRRLERLLAGTMSSRPPAGTSLASVEGFLTHVAQRLGRPRDRRVSAVFVVALDRDDVVGGELTEADARQTAEAASRALKDALRNRDASGKSGEPNVAFIEGARLAIHLDGFERPIDAYKIAQRIQERLEPTIEVAGVRVGLRASVGIALCPEDGIDGAALVAAAVQAVSGARNEPRGAIRFATSATNTAIFARLSLENDLRRAIERSELTVYYQPRVDVRSGRVRGVEALVRWRHPTLGMVSPAQFIPVAEESGLIVPMGSFVLHEACAQNRRWRDEGLPHITVAVNLSSVQLRDPALRGDIEDALHRASLPASSLELELTESMLLEKVDATVATLDSIKALGVKLAIDDFGTGYSNFGYIKRFPIDALKIDQSFVREVTSNPEDAALTTSILLMAKSLGLVTVAEGVETRSQLAFLSALECDEAQGFLFSRPLPPNEIGPMIARGFASAAAA